MRSWKKAVPIALTCVAVLLASAWPDAKGDVAAPAAPDDRVAQLEERIAQLETKIEALERLSMLGARSSLRLFPDGGRSGQALPRGCVAQEFNGVKFYICPADGSTP